MFLPNDMLAKLVKNLFWRKHLTERVHLIVRGHSLISHDIIAHVEAFITNIDIGASNDGFHIQLVFTAE
ncbi:hypothetical protein D3C73_1224120 [compost metagenome]